LLHEEVERTGYKKAHLDSRWAFANVLSDLRGSKTGAGLFTPPSAARPAGPCAPRLLATRADCDTALASLTKEKAAYDRRDYNQTYADTAATDRAGTIATQLAKAIADVAHYTTEVARAGITDAELRTAKRALIAARGRRDNLELSGETTSGPLAYLADVDADQVDAQLATLEAAMQAVGARKAALPA